jgi:periplasmic divalent cation tolerance protein
MGKYDGRLLVLATTFGSRPEAVAVVSNLVEEGLIVCGQVGADLTSFYSWRGELNQEPEVSVLMKVREDQYRQCTERLKQLHPYDVPQMIAWTASKVDDAYGHWAWGEET